MAMKFLRRDIRDACGSRSYTRGLDYFDRGHVLSLDARPLSEGQLFVDAETRGSGGRRYHQQIEIDHGTGRSDIDGICSCPMVHNCKHVAAACLAFLREEAARDEAERAKPKHADTESPEPGQPAVSDAIARLRAEIAALEAEESSRARRGAGTPAHRPSGKPAKKPGEELDSRVGHWLQLLAEKSPDTESTPLTASTVFASDDYLIYLLHPQTGGSALQAGRLQVEIRASHPRKNGRGMVRGKSLELDRLNPRYDVGNWQTTQLDLDIAAFLRGSRDAWSRVSNVSLHGRTGSMALALMLQSGRCYWQSGDSPPLQFGDERELQVGWQAEADGDHHLRLGLGPNTELVATEPPMYIDTASAEGGLLGAEGWRGEQLALLQTAPPLPAEQTERFTSLLLQRYPQLPLPMPAAVAMRDNPGETVQPWLTLDSLALESGRPLHCLRLDFDYAGDRVPALPATPHGLLRDDSGWVRVQRNIDAEGEAVMTLLKLGFTVLPPLDEGVQSLLLATVVNDGIGEDAARWASFLEHDVEQLRARGWRIDHGADFLLDFTSGDWEVRIDDGDERQDWFGLRFDLQVDGERLPLAPLLAPLLQSDAGLQPESLPETLTLPLDGHRYLRLPTARIAPFLDTLRSLFNRAPPDDDGRLRLARHEAASLEDLANSGATLHGGEQWRELARRLRDFSGIRRVAPPPGLHATLRDYQRHGLDWLQFLREYRFNGVLADDMGLGKTLQTLAHLLVEKRAGRLDRPALVVAPTSLMGNWWREAERFAPDLRLTLLHGDNRHARFAAAGDSDLLLTSYPLLSRDAEQLRGIEYHCLILDEAQAIKNPNTKMAQLVRELRSRYRLCLTGTPLENHLGELWALFDFLMPGFLGSARQFQQHYRTPIEKHADGPRREELARRVQPFLLRRDKATVATELPPKSELRQSVELEERQAQLYESIRVSMDRRVREAIAGQGLARSHITVLDALLKLRQVCCDPRLLKLDGAAQKAPSAKLQLLMDLLPELLAEGRRVLLFSQFTSMLGLIEEELQARGIDYSKLTGKTRKRDAAIERFCGGAVDLFLISLKAGGSGLNLAEADTVILYDPWWNPAVEMQAIDRAHRIGQDKPVFIYKLVVENSVEAKMVELQEHKRKLAAGVFAGSAEGGAAKLDAETLRELFAPLGGMGRDEDRGGNWPGAG